MNLTGTGRSNYFRVRDLDAFVADLTRCGVATTLRLESGVGTDPEGSICLLPDGTDTGELPNIPTDPPCDTYTPWDGHEGPCEDCNWGEAAHGADEDTLPGSLLDLIGNHLIDGDVAIVIFVANEGLRYVGGGAAAINSRGETVTVHLDSIYDLAKPLGTTISAAEY